MSVAFTREEDYEAAAAHLPDRPISPHPNLVTAAGLAQVEAALSQARAAHAAAQALGGVQADRTAMARAVRDLRYWSARRASARLHEADATFETLQFGGEATVARAGGRTQTLRIVGEDEADPASGRVSYVSPIARALLGREVGDEVKLGAETLELLAVGP